MSRIPLLGGAYQARSIIASNQQCINLYPEQNPESSPTPVTLYQTPGLRLLRQGAVGEWRGLYRSTNNGAPFGVLGDTVYFIAPGFVLVPLGTLTTTTGQVSMVDNGTTLVIVDGSTNGYQVDLATLAFSQIVDAAFYGSDFVDYQDTFLLFNQPGTKNFYVGPSNSVTPFDPTWIAAKTAWPDKLVAARSLHRELWLIGQLKTEVWSNSGAAAFPFEIVQGAYIEHGCRAKYSIARAGGLGENKERLVALFWYGRDLEGEGVLYRGADYNARRVSNYAVEQEWQRYGFVDNAIGFCYQQDGHVFYQLTFPTQDVTWVYDDSTGQIHRRGWLDSNGVLHRHRANCHAFFYEKHVVGDYENGKLYALDPTYYTDDGDPILRKRTFPHTSFNQGMVAQGFQPVDEGQRLNYLRFAADMSVGNVAGATVDSPAQVSLRWSDTNGASWGNPVVQSIGGGGQYLTQPLWTRLGQGRNRIFELSWALDGDIALNGAFVTAKSMTS